MSLALFGLAAVLTLLWRLPTAPALCVAALNLLAFAVYAFDKGQAIVGRWRAPETVLHLLNLGAPAGAGLARWLANHKTLKPSFSLTLCAGGGLGWVLVGIAPGI